MATTAKEAIDEAKLTQEELATKEKRNYVKSQAEEMQRIQWRNEVDIYINKNSDWTEDEQPQVDTKVRELTKQNSNLAKAITALKKLEKEL